MAPKPDEDEFETIGEDLPDEEDEFLVEMGIGEDGTRMQLGERDASGRMWEPDRDE